MTQSDAPNEASQWGECYDEAVKILSDGDENYKLRRIADLLLANKKMHVAPNERREQKTAEQFLLDNVGRLALSGLKWKSLDDRKNRIIEAMNAYADQQTKHLRDQLSIEKEFRGNLLKDISNLSDQLSKEREEKEKLQAFKDYVHKRLDDAGIPTDPDSPHKAAGCRIGGRLDLVLKEREMRKELVGLIEDMRLNYTESNFEDYNYKINSLLEKASELDKK